MFDVNAKTMVGITTLVAAATAAVFPKDSFKGLGLSMVAFTGLCTKYYGSTAMECLKTGQYHMLATTIVGRSLFGAFAGIPAFGMGIWLFQRDKYDNSLATLLNPGLLLSQLNKEAKDDNRLATVLGAAAFSATALYIGASEAAILLG